MTRLVARCVAALVVMTGLALAATVPTVAQPDPNTSPADSVDGQCVDSAEPLTGPPHDDGEPSVKVPQRAPDRLVASWTTTGDLRADHRTPINGTVILAQRDRTGSWTREALAGPSVTNAPAFDSWLDTSPRGPVYVSYFVGLGATFIRRVVPGRPAGPPLPVAPIRADSLTASPPFLRLDHPALAVDQQHRPQDQLYVVGTKLGYPYSFPGVITLSANGGRTWTQDVPFPPPARRTKAFQVGPVVASGGSTIVVAWTEVGPDGAEPAIRVASFDPDTARFAPARTVAVMGGSWLLPFGAATIPSVSVVRAGRHQGRAYLAWPERRGHASSSVSEVMLSASDDDGLSWSKPRQVNDDVGGGYHIFPSVAASPDGAGFVAWMDTRDDVGNGAARMYGAPIDENGKPHANIGLTRCPAYPEALGSTVGDYFNFDFSQQGTPVMVFPNIRARSRDSDVFLLAPSLRP